MDAFFASVEQLDDPSLLGRPVAVTNGSQGSTIITASYEARQYGIKTGTKLRDARFRCPDLVVTSSSHRRYGEVSKTIMQALANEITPDIEIFSIDEAFLDVTHCQRLHGDPISIAEKVQTLVWEVSGLTCSVGIGGDKTTAKMAAGLMKPAGITTIPPWEAEETLASVSVSRLCGIGPAITKFLAKHGVHVCGDMKKLPVSVLTKRFGPFGYRMWMMCQGKDPAPVNSDIQPPKSVGNGKVIPPQTHEKGPVLMVFSRMAEKVASRLRQNEQSTQHVLVAMRINFSGWVKHNVKLVIPSNDGQLIFELCVHLVNEYWHRGITVQQVQVTALDPSPTGQQTDFFTNPKQRTAHKNQVIDEINQRFGPGVIQSARTYK
jgi:DNA polymerase-4